MSTFTAPEVFTPGEAADLIGLYREIEADVLARVTTIVEAMEDAERRLSKQRGLSFVERRRYIERADALLGARKAFTPLA